MKIMYYNPKNNKYQSGTVLSIEGDKVNCLNVKANYLYIESLAKLRGFVTAENPDNKTKPLVKLIGFK